MAEEQTRQDVPSSEVDLSHEAEELRSRLRAEARLQNRTGFSLPGKILSLALTLGLWAGAVGLLLLPEARKSLVEALAGSWLAPTPGAEIVYSLPPPPPRSPATRPGVQITAGMGGPEADYEGVLYTRTGPPVPGATAPPQAVGQRQEPGFEPPPRTPEAEEALNLLRNRQETVARILSGQAEGYRLVGWNPVKSTPPVFWIDVVAAKGDDNGEIHLVWEVNMERETVRPLSQAARDLSRP